MDILIGFITFQVDHNDIQEIQQNEYNRKPIPRGMSLLRQYNNLALTSLQKLY